MEITKLKNILYLNLVKIKQFRHTQKLANLL